MRAASETITSPGSVAFAGSAGKSLSRTMRGVIGWCCLALLAVSTVYPLVFLAATALRTQADYKADPGGIPGGLTLENVSGAFSKIHIGTLALNSLLVVVPAVVLITVLSCFAAYALAHFRLPFSNGVLILLGILMAFPPMTLVIPIFKVILEAELLNKRLGLILVYTAFNLPFSIFLLTAFMRSVPRELLNAARIDGAGPLRTLWSVVLPLVRPGLLTIVTLNFLFLWNEFLFALVILQKEGSRTIMVGISQFQGHFGENFALVSTGLLLSMIPPLLIFVFFQRSLARGLTAGAVK